MLVQTAVVALAIRIAAPGTPDPLVQRYAADYAAVSQNLDEALALVATARVEGAFDPRVEDCRRTGDHGRAISEFQLQRYWWAGHSRREICGSNRLAARLALRALKRLGFCRGSWWPAFRAYVGCRASDARVTYRARLFGRLQRELGRNA
jgi:hypothetical protein